MSDCSTHAFDVPLKPCPFCGEEVFVRVDITLHPTQSRYRVGCDKNSSCHGWYGHSRYYNTEAEAIAAWNTRAPIEYDGWFYLPKPKEGIVDYGEPEITRTENGYKVRQIADVVDEAARRWGDELGEYVMKRICEAWNNRAERTCKLDRNDVCSECGACIQRITHSVYEMGDGFACYPKYCPNCGARVRSE